MFNADIDGQKEEEMVEEMAEEMGEENGNPSPSSNLPSLPGLAEVVQTVELLRKEMKDELKCIQDKLDAQDARIKVIEDFVKNAEKSVPVRNDEWDNDMEYDFSFPSPRGNQAANAGVVAEEAQLTVEEVVDKEHPREVEVEADDG